MRSHAEFPHWLWAPPDAQQDHDYLTDDMVSTLEDGVFFKRKSALTRRRFAFATAVVDSVKVRVELIDDRGTWQLRSHDVLRLASAAELPFEGDPDPASLLAELHEIGLPRIVGLEGDDLAPSEVVHPRSPSDMAALYEDYTDMDAQGHFDADSPDLLRMTSVIERVRPGTQVVDLGCNSGAFGARLIAQRGCSVAGVDLAARLVQLARSKGLDARVASAEATPFASSSFDYVLCCELLEHVLEPEAVVQEALRLLVGGGRLLITVPHAEGEWGTKDLPYHPEHLRAFDERSLTDLVASAGFTVTHLELHHYGHPVPQEIVAEAVAPL